MDNPPNPPAAETRHWRRGHTYALFSMLALLLVMSYVMPAGRRYLAWWLTLGFLTGFIVVAGHGITGLWRGMFIDEQNKISLSRFQLAFWTILILGSFFVAGVFNLKSGQSHPLGIGLPPEIWALMGISSASLVATPLINYNKANRTPDAATINQTVQSLQSQVLAFTKMDPAAPEAATLVETKGALVIKTKPAYSQWSDMFKSDEAGNADVLDLGKVQMFFFTVVVGLVYAFNLAQKMSGAEQGISGFPELDASMVGLMGISHATYLTKKALPAR